MSLHPINNVMWYKAELLTVDALTFLTVTATPAAFWKRTKKDNSNFMNCIGGSC